MIEQILTHPLTWISSGVCLLLIGCFYLLAQRIENLSLKIAELEEEVCAIGNGAIGVGRQLTAVASELKLVESNQEEMSYRDSHQPKPYLQAAKMAQMGADVQDLMDSCELTQGEAELLVHLHRQSGAA
jgi:hypothetical protein